MSADQISKKQKLLCEYLFSNREVFIKAYSILEPTYFERPLDKVVEFVTTYFSEYHNLPHMDVVEAETAIPLVHRAVEEIEQQYVLDEIEEHCKREAMFAAIMASADLVNEGDLPGIQTLVRDALTVRIDKSLGTELFTNPRERIEGTGLTLDERPVGIPALDQMMSNVRRGELLFVAAATSVGKSITLGNFVYLMARQKLNTLIVSVEMNEDMYSRRMDAMVTGIPLTPLSTEPDIEGIAAALEQMKEDFGRIVTKRVNGKFGLDDLRALIQEYHLIYGCYPDVLALDYIDIFSNGNMPKGVNGKYEWDEIKTHGVRDLMDEFGIYGFTASQLNRDGYGDVMELGAQHIGGGISKSQGADTVLGLIQTDEDIENGTITAVPIKVRNKKKSKQSVTLYLCDDTLRLSDKPFGGKSPAVQRSANLPVQKNTSKHEKDFISSSGKDKLRNALKLTRTGV